MVLALLTDPDALPTVFRVRRRSRDVHVGAELQRAEAGRLRVLVPGEIVHAGEVEDVQGVGIREADDARVSEILGRGRAAFGLPFVAAGDAEEGEWFGGLEGRLEVFDPGLGAERVGAGDEEGGRVGLPNCEFFQGIAVFLDLLGRGGIW